MVILNEIRGKSRGFLKCPHIVIFNKKTAGISVDFWLDQQYRLKGRKGSDFEHGLKHPIIQ